MAVSLFSKPLTLLIGLLIVGVQVCFLIPLYFPLSLLILPSILFPSLPNPQPFYPLIQSYLSLSLSILLSIATSFYASIPSSFPPYLPLFFPILPKSFTLYNFPFPSIPSSSPPYLPLTLSIPFFPSLHPS
jgi:hypothetical protein